MSDAYTFVKRRKVGNPSAKLVLYAIAEYCNEAGVSQPSSTRLREDTELSARTISTALDLLEERQVIRRERSHTEQGRRAPDRIILRGYREWRASLKKLDANSASCDDGAVAEQRHQVQQPHMQIEQVQPPQVNGAHVQNSHVVKRPQDVVAEPEPSPTSLHANHAHAIRQEDNLLTEDNPLFFVEDAIPKRRSAAMKAEAKRVADELWFTWPAVARKRHTRQQVIAAVESVLGNVKLNARSDDLINAGRRHVAERSASDQKFVKGLVPFLVKGLWQNWATDDDEPQQKPIVTESEWRRRVANFEHDGSWSSSYGPRPNQAGYLGPKPQGLAA